MNILGVLAAILPLVAVNLWISRRFILPRQRTPPIPPSHPVAAATRHGGIAYSVRVWKCGRVRVWDGDGTVTWAEDCTCPDQWDDALKRLIDDAQR